MNKTLPQVLSLALLALVLLACGGGSSSGSRPTTGDLSLGITDAAVDGAAQVFVQFTGVTVKPREGADIELALEGDSQSCQDLLNEVDPAPAASGEPVLRCIELKALQGTNSVSLLEGVTLEAGEYNWIRLSVDAERDIMDSIIVLDEGPVESLYVPSGSQSGLKLNTGFTILAGGSHDFVIDFDLRKSVNNPKGFPDYRLKPSLRLIDRAESGNIVGTVEANLLTADGCTADAHAVYAYTGADATIGEEGSANAPLTSASVALNNGSGLYEYTIGFLAPGDYTVAFTCEAGNDSAEEANNGIEFVESADSPTTVVADEDSVVDFF